MSFYNLTLKTFFKEITASQFLSYPEIKEKYIKDGFKEEQLDMIIQIYQSNNDITSDEILNIIENLENVFLKIVYVELESDMISTQITQFFLSYLESFSIFLANPKLKIIWNSNISKKKKNI